MNFWNNLHNFVPHFPRKSSKPALPPGAKLLKSGRLKLAKPPQPTILSATTARRLAYLEREQLASFVGSRFRVAATHFINKLGERVKLPKGIQHHGV